MESEEQTCGRKDMEETGKRDVAGETRLKRPTAYPVLGGRTPPTHTRVIATTLLPRTTSTRPSDTPAYHEFHSPRGNQQGLCPPLLPPSLQPL